MQDKGSFRIEESKDTNGSFEKDQEIDLEFPFDEALQIVKQRGKADYNYQGSSYPDTLKKGFDGGEGTPNNPYLLLGTIKPIEDQIELINQYPDKSFKLMTNAVLNSETFDQIDVFNGNFDGNNKTIRFEGTFTENFTRIGNAQFGLLANTNNGTIKNLNIENANYKSESEYNSGTYFISMGGLVGINNGSISNIKMISPKFEAKRNNSSLGSICGLNRGEINSCEVTNAELTGSGDIGGICGRLYSGEILNCNFSGKINIWMADNNGGTEVRSWGGIVGYAHAESLEKNVSIKNCFSSSCSFAYVHDCGNYHHIIIFGIHSNCNLQLKVGMICGHFDILSQNDLFVGNEFDKNTCKTVITDETNQFHYGDHEKANLFAYYDGKIGLLTNSAK